MYFNYIFYIINYLLFSSSILLGFYLISLSNWNIQILVITINIVSRYHIIINKTIYFNNIDNFFFVIIKFQNLFLYLYGCRLNITITLKYIYLFYLILFSENGVNHLMLLLLYEFMIEMFIMSLPTRIKHIAFMEKKW